MNRQYITKYGHRSTSKQMRARRHSNVGLSTKNHSVSFDKHLFWQKHEQAKRLMECSQYSKAVRVIKKLLHSGRVEEQWQLLQWLGTSLLALDQPKQALQAALKCEAMCPDHFETCLLLGSIYVRLQNESRAIFYFSASIALQPLNPISYLNFAKYRLQLTQNPQALHLLQEGVLKCPSSVELLFYLAELKIKMGQCAIDICAKLTKMQGQKSSAVLYLSGLIAEYHCKEDEACMLFDEALKHNNPSHGVTQSLLRLLAIEVGRRDFYKALHYIFRASFLTLTETPKLRLYSQLIEGVISLMKKKFSQAIRLLSCVQLQNQCKTLNLLVFTYKYLAYGYFKLKDHLKAVQYYKKIQFNQMDQCTKYNFLIAQGICLVDHNLLFQQAISQFQAAKNIYPLKVEPYLYIAMTIIGRNKHILQNPHNQSNQYKDKSLDIRRNNHLNNSRNNNQQIEKGSNSRHDKSIIEAFNCIEQAYKINTNSSNLLYHRAIFHMYLGNYKEGEQCINKCIQVAQQNLPKYFYLRGVCYCGLQDFERALNEFSISISLCPQNAESYFEKANCLFKLGEDEKALTALNQYLDNNQQDQSVWLRVGQLLYQNHCYKQAIKVCSQKQITSNISSELTKNDKQQSKTENNILEQCKLKDSLFKKLMVAKCMVRVRSVAEVIEFVCQNKRIRTEVDETALILLHTLTEGADRKSLECAMHKMNRLLQNNEMGCIFELIDCMNLLGVSSFYSAKYNDAYQSFLLAAQLFKFLSQNTLSSSLFDLQLSDIYLNLFFAHLKRKDPAEALRLLIQDYLQETSSQPQKNKIQKIISSLQKDKEETVCLQAMTDKINSKFKKVECIIGKVKIIGKVGFKMYHQNVQCFGTEKIMENIVNKFHAGYIDDMPEGPWIKRNNYGVVFTEQLLQSQYTPSLQASVRDSQSKNANVVNKEEQKKRLLASLKFDEGIEMKLKSLMQKHHS